MFFGVANHLLFAFTVWRLFWFLGGEGPEASGGPLWIDALLALQFSVVHSLLLLPAVRKRLESVVPSAQYGCFFCAATCITLQLLMTGWQTSPAALWRLDGWGETLVTAGYFGSWAFLLYSISLTGFGYQTGFATWWPWVRGQEAPRRTFEPRGLYLLLRHPVYLGFLGLIWCNPQMTLDRGVLLGVWTAYVFTGSFLKDRRLVYYIGERYRRYQSQVVGFPGMPLGPLAKVPLDAASAKA